MLMNPQPNFWFGLFLAMGCTLCLAGAIALWIPLRVRRITRVIIVLCILLAGLILYVHFGPYYVHTRAEITNEFDELVQQQKWAELANKLPSLEGDSNLHDVWLYFRGVLLRHSGPRTSDPDQYLSLVPQDSDLFEYAQMERANGLVTNPNDVRLRDSIVEALLRARMKNSLYFVLRLQPPSEPSHDEVMDLYEEFVALHKELFDFEHMRPRITYKPSIPVSFRVVSVGTIPGCTLLFFLRRLETAYRDCVLSDVAVVSSQYDLLRRSVRRSELE
jgi:hypothetical protein